MIGLFLYGLRKKSGFIGKMIITIYAFGAGFIILMAINAILSRKKVLERSDFYEEYTIDRNFFSGKQADWQYNNFRFEIVDHVFVVELNDVSRYDTMKTMYKKTRERSEAERDEACPA